MAKKEMITVCGENGCKTYTKAEYRKAFPLSKKAKAELRAIHKQVEKDLKPLYDGLGVDMKTEELHWTNGEVFVINKKTRQRREIGPPQPVLNAVALAHAIQLGKKMKEGKNDR